MNSARVITLRKSQRTGFFSVSVREAIHVVKDQTLKTARNKMAVCAAPTQSRCSIR